MPFVMSAGALVETQPDWWPIHRRTGSVRLYDQFNYDYATLYRTQPNVRTCVDFLARNIAQLGLHVFRRVSDTDRERLTDHPLAQVLSRPLPASYKVTTYRLIESLVADLGVYFNAYWLKVRGEGGEPGGLLRIPPAYVEVSGGLYPSGYKIVLSGREIPVKPEDIVHIRGYNAENAVTGLSPLETLRRVLAEEHSAGDYREHLWANAARMEGIIERPAEAPEWSPTARERFKAEFEALHSGGENSGKTAILEEGMEWKAMSFNAQEAEYLAGRKLTREECARAYHIPLPMVGILDNATFSNIKEQHKNLYQDSLGPWLAMIEQDVDLQLLPEFEDSAGVYVEFNINEKLQGDFEDQTNALQSAVGRPWMTANEARARLNLPSMGGDADELVTPLNVIVGGQASPRDSGKGIGELGNWGIGDPSSKKDRGLDTYQPALRERHEGKWMELLTRFYRRQEAAIVSRVPGIAGRMPAVQDDPAPTKTDIGGMWWDDERWNGELYEDLLRLNVLTAGEWAGSFAERLETEVSEERMLPWLEEHSRIQATYINEQTRDQVAIALREPDALQAVKDVFVLALSSWAVRQATSAVTSAANFGAHEAANAGGLSKKTWRVNSSNPRDSHLAQDGVSVGIRDSFPNGQRWPGDPRGGAEENANCDCSVEFGR
jgi:HK97 family phage portal protein